MYQSLTSRASEVALVVKNLPANAGDVRDMGLTPESGRFPGVLWPGESLGQRSLVGYSPQGCRVSHD